MRAPLHFHSPHNHTHNKEIPPSLCLPVLVLAAAAAAAHDTLGSELTINISPANQVAHYFQTKEAAEGQTLPINGQMTVSFEFQSTATNTDFGDIMSFGGNRTNGCWVSFNLFLNHSAFDVLSPNVNDQQCGLWYGGREIRSAGTNLWHSVAVSIVTSTNGFSNFYGIDGYIDRTNPVDPSYFGNYPQAFGGYVPPFPLSEVTICFTNTPTSTVTSNVNVRNIWITTSAYKAQALSLLSFHEKSSIDPTQVITLTSFATNWTYAAMRYSTDVLHWSVLNPLFSRTGMVALPFFKDTLNLFALPP